MGRGVQRDGRSRFCSSLHIAITFILIFLVCWRQNRILLPPNTADNPLIMTASCTALQRSILTDIATSTGAYIVIKKLVSLWATVIFLQYP